MPRILRAPVASLLLLLAAGQCAAIDVVVRRGGAQRDGGTVSRMTKVEVTVSRQVGGDTTVPVNEIAWIEWDGAPAALSLGRAALGSGQLDVAEKQLDQALTEAAGSNNTNLLGDLNFLRARAAAQRALTDASQAADAASRLQAFLSGNRDHYRTYEAQLLRGEVALAAGDFPAAITAFTAVSTAPWKDVQMAAQIGQGKTLLAQNNVDGAQREFDAVAAVRPENPAQTSRRLEGLLGQAHCRQLQDRHQEAVEILDQIINESAAADSRLQAEAYVRQGDSYVAMGASPKAAIMAYLHVDVIPALSKESDLHAEALYQLARLWNQIGQVERARESAEALQGTYPQSEWARKLGG